MVSRSDIPNFFVIGVVKGGTTSLYHYLDQHPDIYLPPIKETNHFAAKDIYPEHFLPEYALDVKIDLDRYIRNGMREQIHIAHVDSDDHYRALFSKVQEEKAIGEISNSYMICPSAAKAIYEFNPDAKIMVVLRNPIKRAWSQYLMNLREAKSDASDFIKEIQEDHAADPKGWGVNHQYLELGKYAGQLKRYFELFGREKVLVIFFEEYKKMPEATMRKVCDFLNVDSDFNFDLSGKSNASSLPRNAAINRVLTRTGVISAAKRLTPKPLRQKFANVLYSDKNMPDLGDEQIAWLRDYYAEEVEELSKLLSQNLHGFWPEFQITYESK